MTNKPYREFHLYMSDDCYDTSICEVTGHGEDRFWTKESTFAEPNAHVIEYSALLAEREKFAKLVGAAKSISTMDEEYQADKGAPFDMLHRKWIEEKKLRHANLKSALAEVENGK